ncbi:hypothetical protein EGY25_03220 [Brevundimonas intermedia]|uniref:Uncharacterized protein n=1 Tax=Brevundimonas intermedia TaxID=74315 RepID=A0A4Y9S065_9CAUL|nr:hypothetical protein EGY25_03220 [Brevundimonas intermedia]
MDPATVVGWGVDADPKNDPTWPIRDRSGDDGARADWTPPSAQVAGVEILQSVEYGRRPAVVGESTPPAGLSGMVRRAAFRFSEGQWGHWLLLMGADRLNTVEGLLQDFRRGRMPNPLFEMGFVKHERRHEAALATAAVVGVAVAGLVLLNRRRHHLSL